MISRQEVRTRASVDAKGVPGNNYSLDPSISGDGHYIAFAAGATDLVSGDTNGRDDVFVRDRQAGTITHVFPLLQMVHRQTIHPLLHLFPAMDNTLCFMVLLQIWCSTTQMEHRTSLSIGRTFLCHPPQPQRQLHHLRQQKQTHRLQPILSHLPPLLPASTNPLYLSLSSGQTIGGVSSADEDILKFDGSNWSVLFDGSDVGVGSPDLFAFSFLGF